MENLLSNEYRAKIEAITQKMPWGGDVVGSVPRIYKYASEHNCKSILDYGSGKSDFLKTMDRDFPDHGFQINQYEPARPELAGDPVASDMVICVDVLEHIEPDKLDNVLDHIASKANKIFYFKICLVASFNSFEDGTNLHLIVEPKEFWLDKLSKYYTIEDIIFARGHVWGLAIKK